MKILITGGAGFIGSHLAEKLVGEGHDVLILDDLSTGSLQNIQHLIDAGHVSFTKGDVMRRGDVAPLAEKADFIFHLAAAVGVRTVVDKPLESMVRNIEGTQNVIEAAAKKGVPFLVTSSSEVYGKNDDLPFHEHSERVYGSAYNERWGYALSKAVDEFMALAYWREKKLPTITVRLFNTTGPRQTHRYGMVIPNFVNHALRNEPLIVHGDGEQVRAFSHVSDIVSGLVDLMNAGTAVYGEIFNLGSTEAISINDLAKRVIQHTGSASLITHVPYHEVYNATFEDMRKRVPNISKIQEAIGYAPRYTLDDTIKAIIGHYQSL
ncbi:MAG: GDP-mannose 4,6-dehydratase [Candidatus Paceibacterota bacterium]|jgi:UDP-glucose 4-epimerase